MVYFVSGHRDLSPKEFSEYYAPLLDKILEDDLFADFVVGDWEGCDTMFLEYILSKPNYNFISIYYVDKLHVNPMGSDPESFENVFTYKLSNYDECDKTMTNVSDFDIAWIRPGREDSHTADNIKRRYNL